MKKKSVLTVIKALVLLLLVCSMCSCSAIDADNTPETTAAADTPPQREPYPVGVGEETFEQSPASVASLSPAITQALCGLGLSDRIVGVSSYCAKPADSVTVIGSPAFPDIDKIIELAPELVITQSPLASTDEIRLKQAGVRTLYIPTPTSFSYLCEEYINLALIFYGNVDSREVASEALSEIDSAMVAARELGLDIEYIAINDELDGTYMVSCGGDLQTNMLGAYGQNVLDGRQSHFISLDELSEISADVAFVDMSLPNIDDVTDALDSDTKVVYIDSAEFEMPTAALSETITYINSELSE